MVNDSQSSSKIKDDESNSSKKKFVNGKGSPTLGAGTNDTSGLRRSARETSSSKQMTPSPPSTRKSERLVKQMSVSPLIKKKSERIKKQLTFSPVRRSDRGKKHTSSSSSGSKKSDKTSGSLDMKQLKRKREKSLKQLTVEVKEVSRSEDPTPACGKRKKMDARSFKTLLKKQRRRKAAAVSDEDVVKASDRGGIVEETSVDAEKLLVDCSTEEQLQNPELVGSASMGKSLDDGIEVGTGDNTTSAKRKSHHMVIEFDTSAMDARKDVCTTSSDDVYSSSECKIHDLSETCVECSKRRRVDHDSRSQDFCSCSTTLNKDSNETNIPKNKSESLVKLSILPVGSPPGLDNSYLDTLNKLREFLHKGQSAVVFDDQDRIMKIILFIISLTDICRPFLIVTSSNSLPLWEAELLRMAPSIDIVLYSGNSDNRRSIRKMKFYDEGGRIMFQVLLSSLEAVVEDLQVFESLKWKAVIVDECQQSRVSSQFEQIKMLATDVKVLLFSGPIKDSVTEYLHLLSLLDCHGDFANFDGPKPESNDNLCKLKERLSQYIAFECKSDSSKFVEFWVPSQISNVQLEQYCSTLLSNSLSLCSCSKTDPVGALRDILFSTRKCCDHPYIVDPSLIGLITKDLPAVSFLDVGIKASGKLQLLEVILSEMKKRQLRVLILYQSIGGFGRDLLGLGDILDDFLRERFGLETYERVDGGAVSSKSRQIALNNFNNKESGRFVFLLENRACFSSIKLSSVDTIIIFDSDWDPANDIKALHRISIDSQFKQIKIFRLYSSCTVEEKVLILAKQGQTLESKLQNICCATSKMLLMWGASYLLNRLDEFHSTPDTNISSEQSLLNKVVEEFLALLSQSGENNDIDNPIILKIQQREGVYSSNQKLLGELQVKLSDGELPHVFWTNMLKGRNPQWKFLSGKTQRHRKKVQYFDRSPKKPEVETVEVGKKRKEVVTSCINPANLKPGLEQSEVEVVGGGTSGIPIDNGFRYSNRSDACDAPAVESEESTLPDAQKSLYLLVKPDISKLCEILKLSDEVKLMVGRFLEYVIANHQIHKEPASILQAFLISLCWSAASLLKQKIDKKESLSLAKHHLNFSCNEEEADCLYSVLRKMKKTFKENIFESDFSKDSISGAEDVMKGPLSERVSRSASFNFRNERVLLPQVPNYVLQPKSAQNDKTDEEDTLKSFKLVQRKCKKRMAKLLQKQEEETKEFHRDWENRRAAFDNKYRVESAIIREMYSHTPLRMDKLKVLNSEHAKKMKEHERLKEIDLKQLEAKQLGALNDERKKITCWLKSARSSANEARGQDELTLHGSEFESQVGYSQASENRSHSVSENDATVSSHLIEEQSPDGIADNKHVNGIMPADTCTTVPKRVVECNSHNETVGTAVNPNVKNDVVENMSSVARSQLANGICNSINVSEDNVSTSQCHSGKQIADGILLSGPGEMAPPELPERIAEEVMGTVDSVEIGTLAVESNGENDRREEVCSDTPNAVENHSQNVEANSSISGDSPSAELSLLKLPFSRPEPSPACDSSLSRNLVLPYECSRPHLSSDIRDEDLRVEVPSLQPVDAEQIDQSNQDSPLVEPLEHIEQPQPRPPLSTYSPLDRNQPDLPPASGSGFGTITEGHTPKSAEVSCQLSEVPSELSDRSVSLPVANVELRPPIDDTDIPLVHNQLDLRSANIHDHQTSGDLNSSFHNDEASSQVVEHTAELPNQVIPHFGVNVERHPPIQSTGIPLRQNQRDIPSASRLDCQPSGEALPDVERTAELPNQAIFHTGVNVSSIQGFNNLSLHAERQVPSRIPNLASYGDPLQNELERIRKETEQAIKAHEDMKLRLKSDLEEIIAQLRREYEAKLKDAKSEFLLKKNELDTNYNKVLMNKILADAFMSKCLDIGPSRPMAMQHGVPHGLAQHLNLSPLHPTPTPTPRSSPTTVSSPVGQSAASQQNTAPLLQPGSRLSPVTVSISTGQPEANLQNMEPQLQPVPMVLPIFVSSSSGLPASSQQTATPPLQPASRLYPVIVSSSTGLPAYRQQNTALQLQPAPRVSPVSVSSSAGQPAANRQNTAVQLQPAPRVSPISVSSSAGQPAASQQSTAPLQIVHQSGALFSSTPTRTPQINPITPSTGNLRVGSEIRAPAPHLQPFRSASAPAVNFTSLPRVMPSHLTPTSLPTMSHSLPQAPPCPRAAPISTNYSGSVCDRSPQSSTASGLSVPGLSSPINSSLSCLDLIMDVHKQHGAHSPNDFPPVPVLGLKLDSLDLPVLDNVVSMRVSSPPAAVTTMAVCLSDDD